MSNQLSLSKNTNRALAAVAFLQQNPQLRGQVLGAARGIGNQLSSYFGGSPAVTFPTATSNRGISMQMLNPRRKKAKGGGQRKRRSGTRSGGSGAMGNPQRSANLFEPRIVFKFLTPVTTATTTGISASNIFMGYHNTNFTTDFATMSTTQYTSLAAAFSYEKIHSIRVCFVPTVAYTTSGLISLAINEDPTISVNPVSLQAVDERRVAATCDVKERICIVWTPKDEQAREAKEANTSGGTVGYGLRNYQPCSLIAYASSNALRHQLFLAI